MYFLTRYSTSLTKPNGFSTRSSGLISLVTVAKIIEQPVTNSDNNQVTTRRFPKRKLIILMQATSGRYTAHHRGPLLDRSFSDVSERFSPLQCSHTRNDSLVMSVLQSPVRYGIASLKVKTAVIV